MTRPGIVLPAVLMTLLVLELLTATTIVLALQQSALARDRALGIRAQLGARSAAALALVQWERGAYQRLSPGEQAVTTFSLDAQTSATVTVERVSPTLFSVRAAAAVTLDRSLVSQAAAGLLIGALDTGSMLAYFPAALGVGGALRLTGGSTIDAVTTACTERPAAALALADTTALVAAGGSNMMGSPPLAERAELADPATFAGLGTVGLAGLLARADRSEVGALELRPALVAGRCDTDAAANWGAPLDSTHACANYFPLIHAAGDLAVRSGAGQGILVVEGDLAFDTGTEFHGLILVRGRILAAPGARIRGSALIQGAGRVSQLHGAHVIFDACLMKNALGRSPALNRPIFRRNRIWIPAF